MKYEVVELEQKTVVGKSITTSNDDPKMGEQIGKLWFQLYDPKTGYDEQIKNKLQQSAIGLYSDYAGKQYQVTVGAQVSKSENPELITKTIAKGKYAKFSIHGNMITAVAKAWGEIWQTPLKRTFTGDFEEYLPCTNCEHIAAGEVGDACTTCEDCYINIYVAIQ